ncbi:MAG TPA: hypothetical protein VJ747_05750 [Stellaceae bacterium]|nr:hypothetical protein [Stellaceae bacterium]
MTVIAALWSRRPAMRNRIGQRAAALSIAAEMAATRSAISARISGCVK